MPGETVVCQKQNDGLSLLSGCLRKLKTQGLYLGEEIPTGYTLVRARLHSVRSLGPSSITAARCAVLARPHQPATRGVMYIGWFLFDISWHVAWE